jgi:C2H2 transcription facotor
MAAQSVASAPFLYYSPDPNAENRYHGHFTPHPGMHQQQMTMYPVVPTLPSTPVYSRPGSSSSQVMLQPRALVNVQARALAASPRPLAGQKPVIVLETEIREGEAYYSPSTPPLSSSGSTIGSPNSCDMLQTPLNPMFSGLDGVQVKPISEEDAHLERFPTLDWSKCASPPMTPGMCKLIFCFCFPQSCLALYWLSKSFET